MNNMNFFGWIRDGVRQSVLLGVSDAVEQLGTPAAVEDLHPSVAGLLKLDEQNASTPKLTQRSSSSSSSNNSVSSTSSSSHGTKSRRRLGKSLKEMGTAAQ